MGKKLEVVQKSLEAAHALRVDESLSYYTKDATYRFGSFPPATGIENIRKNLNDTHVDIMKSLHQEVIATWEIGDTVIIEMLVRITRIDDKVVEMPCVDIIRLTDDDRIRDFRVYMDMGPFLEGIELPNYQKPKS